MPANRMYDMPLPVVIGAAGTLAEPVAIAISSSDQRLSPANPKRVGGWISNGSTSTVFVRFSSSTVSAAAGGHHWAIPSGSVPVRIPDGYAGEVRIVGQSLASGPVTLTEIVVT